MGNFLLLGWANIFLDQNFLVGCWQREPMSPCVPLAKAGRCHLVVAAGQEAELRQGLWKSIVQQGSLTVYQSQLSPKKKGSDLAHSSAGRVRSTELNCKLPKRKTQEMVDWSKNLTTCQSVSRGRPNLELAAQSRQLQPFFSTGKCRGYYLPRCPILYRRISRYPSTTQAPLLLPGAKGPHQLRPWFRYLGQAADGLTSWGVFSTCHISKLTPCLSHFHHQCA